MSIWVLVNLIYELGATEISRTRRIYKKRYISLMDMISSAYTVLKVLTDFNRCH